MKKLLCKILAVCSILSMSGCNDVPEENEREKDIIVVIGNTSNRPLADLSLIYDDIEQACSENANISLIVDDGMPFVAKSLRIPEIDRKKSATNQKRDIQTYTAQVLSACKNVMPLTSEIDTYGALALADRMIDPSHDTKIVMLDSLLPTAGKINFAEKPLYLTNVYETVQSFSESLTYLSCAEINIYGVGEVSAGQPQLSNDDYNKLIEFWSEFFQTTGCSNVNISKKPYTVHEPPPDDFPEVSMCIVSQDINKISVNSEEYTISESSDRLYDNTVIEFDSEMISFSPDTADILNRKETVCRISNIAGKINNTEQPVILVGMTASYGDAESSEELSLKRAEAVKNLFVGELGVSADKIICIGTGYNDNRLRVDDLNPDGSLNEEKAQQNRKVIAMTETTAREANII